jgi:hypothetical protein
LILVNFSALAERPLFAPLAPILHSLPEGRLPGPGALNALAEVQGFSPLSGGLKPIRFDTATGDVGYEDSVFHRGLVPTRADNWHDLFNALVWLTFPRTKAALNARHIGAREAGDANRARGRLGDALTHFDECGTIVACSEPSLMEMLRRHEWRGLFWDHRRRVIESMGFFVFGHASYDLLREPFVGLCGKAVFVDVPATFFAMTLADQLSILDGVLAERWLSRRWYSGPSDLAPLPLLGIPGATPDNECARYYEDTRQFRPRRKP